MGGCKRAACWCNMYYSPPTCTLGPAVLTIPVCSAANCGTPGPVYSAAKWRAEHYLAAPFRTMPVTQECFSHAEALAGGPMLLGVKRGNANITLSTFMLNCIGAFDKLYRPTDKIHFDDRAAWVVVIITWGDTSKMTIYHSDGWQTFSLSVWRLKHFLPVRSSACPQDRPENDISYRLRIVKHLLPVRSSACPQDRPENDISYRLRIVKHLLPVRSSAYPQDRPENDISYRLRIVKHFLPVRSSACPQDRPENDISYRLRIVKHLIPVRSSACPQDRPENDISYRLRIVKHLIPVRSSACPQD
ncbi:hypothetical protein J6590_016770 [Homalodisca vitripennis]|nr:hypothetical protein J6590_016770 [Homalodisca vitripennis]